MCRQPDIYPSQAKLWYTFSHGRSTVQSGGLSLSGLSAMLSGGGLRTWSTIGLDYHDEPARSRHAKDNGAVQPTKEEE